MNHLNAKQHSKMFILTCLFFLQALISYAQNNIRISIGKENLTIKEALKEIEKQSKMSVAYNESKINGEKRIQTSIVNRSLDEAMNMILAGTGFGYRLQDEYIVIVPPKQETVEKKISGTVVDENGEPLIGATISARKSGLGTVTDLDGNFTLSIEQGSAVLISYLGYLTKEITVTNQDDYSIKLLPDAKQLETVVVTALGIKRAEKVLSYNVQTINSNELTTVKSANFINTLTGKVAGATINNSAAGPGAAVKVVMRGAKSLTKNNNALYVIDGIPMYNSNYGNNTTDELYSSQPGSEGAADINPDDIENISLLTGPSAAALYGYEGANGIVLITTKKGRTDKTSVSLSNGTTFSNPLMIPKFQNIYGNIAGETASWGNKTERSYDPAKFFNTGSNISNSLSLATGNDKSQSYFSAAATNSAGILPNNEYNRYNFSYRNTTSFQNDKFILDASINYIIQKDKNMVSQGQYFNPLLALYLFPRGEDFGEVRLFERYDELSGVNTQFWTYGDQGLSLQNPYWIMHRMNRESNKRRYKLSVGLQYNINSSLNIIGRVNVDNSDYRNTEKRNAGTLATFAGSQGYFRLDNRGEQQTYADIIANYNNYAGNFSININAGASVKDFRMNSHSVMGNLNKITNWFTTENLSRTNGFKMDDDGKRQQSQSLFANAEIGYRSRLYLTLTGRNDWDSALAFSESGEKSFFYPSIGLAVIVSEMVRLPKWFSFLKVRSAFTSVGTAYDPYITGERYEYNTQTDQYNTQLLYPNRNLKPELTSSYEAGLNMLFFNNSFRLDATYYKSMTQNQTFIATLPSSSAYSGVYVQAGNVQNSGIEMSLGYGRQWGSFGWKSSVTYSSNENIVNKLANDIQNPITGEKISMPYLDKATLGSTGSPIVRLTEGGTMGDIYVNRDWKRDDNGYIYLDPVTSLPSLVDTGYKKAGSLLAKSHAGWQNSITYKGVTLSALISGRFGGLVVSNTQAFLDRYGVSESSAKLRETDGISISNKKIQAKDYFNIVADGTGQGAHYVYDATNIRLTEVALHYTIQKKSVNNIADITVSVVANNLAMIYCKAPFDPELVASPTNTFYTGVDYFMQPSLRNIGFNVKLQF
ncbi:MAG: SusC/RagA family TonB-linked outer membrane protein [Dysgonamonadaceae bacterium]|jgi:TonB-linked SusC/RagA family outer membrane protein|nr:SusC/RagA family TonB-linked outer membrane protein [Dysgonamonadaceae bacterium]